MFCTLASFSLFISKIISSFIAVTIIIKNSLIHGYTARLFSFFHLQLTRRRRILRVAALPQEFPGIFQVCVLIGTSRLLLILHRANTCENCHQYRTCYQNILKPAAHDACLLARSSDIFKKCINRKEGFLISSRYPLHPARKQTSIMCTGSNHWILIEKIQTYTPDMLSRRPNEDSVSLQVISFLLCTSLLRISSLAFLLLNFAPCL